MSEENEKISNKKLKKFALILGIQKNIFKKIWSRNFQE